MPSPVKARITANAWVDLIIRHRNDFYIIIVLSGSQRKGGNTDLLVDAFVKGAEKNNIAHENPPNVNSYTVIT